jgi:predicted acylesterase/phospholipase RssA
MGRPLALLEVDSGIYVLDRLLEEPSFAIDGISATSAGAINAVVLAHGLTVGGREGAKKALFDFLAPNGRDGDHKRSSAVVVRPLDPQPQLGTFASVRGRKLKELR